MVKQDKKKEKDCDVAAPHATLATILFLVSKDAAKIRTFFQLTTKNKIMPKLTTR